MLSEEDERLIARSIASADHDYFVWSGLLGEPFLQDGTLSYFDGDTACVVGHPLEEAAMTARRRLSDVIQAWSRRQDVHFINYFGPDPVGALPREQWHLLYAADPQPWNREIFLDLRVREEGRFRGEIRSQLRATARHGLTVRFEHRDFLTHEHIRLLRALALSHRMIASGASYLANIASILRSPATVLCEGRVDGALAGFTVTHEHFEGRPFLVVAAFNRAHRGTSDAIHAALIDHYRAGGAWELGMGYAVDEGLYRYKTKWPGPRLGPPCHQAIWQRIGSTARYTDCLHWPWRLMTDSAAAERSIHDPRWLPSYRPIAPEAVRVPLPDIAHLMDSSSGSSALLAVCRYYGLGPADGVEFMRHLSLESPWPDPDRLFGAARSFGLQVETRHPMSAADLIGFLDQRKPVLILLQAWGEEDDESPRAGYRDIWEDCHWLVAIGHDAAGVVFADPSLEGVRGYLTFDELESRWHGWGPCRMPLDHLGAAVWAPLSGHPAYLSRAQLIM